MTAGDATPAQQDPAKRVMIFDTTLRDGEQSPGIALNTREKVEIAQQLARLGVDVIEAGFPISSPGDFEATRAVAVETEGLIVAALSRANERDVTRGGRGRARRAAPAHPHVHRHQRHPPHVQAEDGPRGRCSAAAVDAVRLARSMVDDVEFSCEDATRSDPAFVAEVVARPSPRARPPSTSPTPSATPCPTEFQAFLVDLYDRCPALRDVVLSVALPQRPGAGGRQLAGRRPGGRAPGRGCINGIGERAGNASVEELVMTLRTRADALGGLWCGIVTPELTRTSSMVSRMTGYVVQPNKAIVGRNAFAHEAGIHQHGMLKQPADLRDHGLRVGGPGPERDRAGQALGPPRAGHGAGGAGLRAGPRRARPRRSPGSRRSPTGRARSPRPTSRPSSTTRCASRPRARASSWRSSTSWAARARSPGRAWWCATRTATRHEAEAVGDGPGRRADEGDRRGGRQHRRAARVPGVRGHQRQATRWARRAWSATSAGAASRDRRSRPTSSRRARSPTSGPSTRAATPSTASASRRGVSDGPDAVPEGVGRPRGRPADEHGDRRSSTSTCTWCTRSPRRRPSTACGWRAGASAARPHPRDGRPQRPDHRTRGRHRRSALGRPARGARAQLRRVRHPALLDCAAPRQGIVHVIGPELGLTQPGMTIVCGDSHTSTHGAFGALAFGIGTSEVEHVLATQTLTQAPPRTMRISIEGETGLGVGAKDIILGTIGADRRRRRPGPRHRVRRRGDPRAVDGRPHDGLQHVHRGRRPGGDDRARRHHLRLARGTARRAGGLRGRGRGWRELPSDWDARLRRARSTSTRQPSRRRSRWGTNPGMVAPVDRPGAHPRRLRRPGRPRRRPAGARVHGPATAARPIEDIAARRGLHRLVHQRPPRRPARRGRGRARASASPPACGRWSCPARCR